MLKRNLLAAGFAVLVISISASTSAQTSCLAYPSGATPPSGYAASWDVFSSARELLVRVNCPSSGTNLTVTVGKGDPNQVVHNAAWSYTGSWTRHLLAGTAAGTGWLSGSGTATLGAPANTSAANPFFFVGYVCTNRSGAWKCGCENTACTTGKWQLQGYTGRAGSSTGGPTVGGTAACPLKNDLFLNPFNKDSAHHKPIGTGAVYAPMSDERNEDFHHWDSFGINLGSTSWGLYTVKAPADGPMYTVNKVDPDSRELPATVRMPMGGVPHDFPEGHSDGNVAIWDEGSGKINHFRRWKWDAGAPKAFHYRQYDQRGLGHGTRTVMGPGTSASDVASPFGILRGYEANTPGVPIQHALQFVAPRNGGACHNLLGRTTILPATGMDGNIEPGDNTGSVPYGSLFAIPPESKGGPRLESLGLSEPGLRLARAIRDYGMYLVDGGACGPAIRADQDVNKNLFMNEIPKFYEHIRVVDNSEWNPSHDATGGGTPIAPNCAFDAP